MNSREFWVLSDGNRDRLGSYETWGDAVRAREGLLTRYKGECLNNDTGVRVDYTDNQFRNEFRIIRTHINDFNS